jgi:hypothetical protein
MEYGSVEMALDKIQSSIANFEAMIYIDCTGKPYIQDMVSWPHNILPVLRLIHYSRHRNIPPQQLHEIPSKALLSRMQARQAQET